MTVLEKVAFDETPRVRLKASPDLPGVSVSVNSQKTVIEL